jgi:tetraacyldisaccharide 4'-kinase
MRRPDFWQHMDGAARWLAPLGALYGASVAFKARFARPYRAPAKVICVGNLTAGGSGKTPVTLAIGAMLLARGHKVFFLTRGYGGKARHPMRVTPAHDARLVGDEALLLARIAPTIVARDRAEGAALACAQGAQIIVMDDGFQNFTLAKDLSIVVIDGQAGFGNGRMIPAGPLREPVAQGLARADAVIVMNGGNPGLEDFRGALLRARLAPQGRAFAGRRVLAFAGIGRPEKFIASLEETGALVADRQFFPDHHVFRRDEIDDLKSRAKGACLVTTEKDYVRLDKDVRRDVQVLKVAVEFADAAALEKLLAPLASGNVA